MDKVDEVFLDVMKTGGKGLELNAIQRDCFLGNQYIVLSLDPPDASMGGGINDSLPCVVCFHAIV